MVRKCGNCKHRWWNSWSGLESCMWYEITTTEEEEIKEAKDCGKYEFGDPFEEEEYTPSSTMRDYGPSNPWDAPGMSVRDFI